jgi:hypothetical protein
MLLAGRVTQALGAQPHHVAVPHGVRLCLQLPREHLAGAQDQQRALHGSIILGQLGKVGMLLHQRVEAALPAPGDGPAAGVGASLLVPAGASREDQQLPMVNLSMKPAWPCRHTAQH